MSQEDWAKKYGAMDQRVQDEHAELPNGEQIGKKFPWCCASRTKTTSRVR